MGDDFWPTLYFYLLYFNLEIDIPSGALKTVQQAVELELLVHGAFYAWALYTIDDVDRAYNTLRAMVPGPDEKDLIRRGQLPIFIPNYYRGGHGIEHLDRTAGRSSQLFNTGTVSWAYRCFIEGLCGLRGVRRGLKVEPKMPSSWDGMKVRREFRGAVFDVQVKRGDADGVRIMVDGEKLDGNVIEGVEKGRTYRVQVELPKAGKNGHAALRNGLSTNGTE
jgi:cellobionic acid phosphorylase